MRSLHQYLVAKGEKTIIANYSIPIGIIISANEYISPNFNAVFRLSADNSIISLLRKSYNLTYDTIVRSKTDKVFVHFKIEIVDTIVYYVIHHTRKHTHKKLRMIRLMYRVGNKDHAIDKPRYTKEVY